MSNKSGVSSQVLTLPSGGGALQGIGETFSPDLLTGAANFTVKLRLPPGRNGFQPEVALLYSTGTGNSAFGLGWELGIPGVSRKTSAGVPRYRDDAPDPSERDTFILSGAEDLVPVTEPAAGIVRYQPRTEGIFSQIERVKSAGADVWRVRDRSGLVNLYGEGRGADPPVVADPRARARIYCWKLAQTTDPCGNRIEYRYRRDSGADGPHTWDQLYLSRIDYGDFEENGQTRFLVSVSFLYDERPDPFSDCRAGFEIRTRLRCKRIEIRTHADQDRLLRAYDLRYVDERVQSGELPAALQPLNGVSLLSQIGLTGHDGNRTETLPPLELGYTNFEPKRRRFQPIVAAGNALPPRSLADDDFEMVDLFGHGLPDVVQMNGTAQFWRNLGNGRFDSPRPMAEVPAGVHLRDPGVQFADMNGDGRADLLVLEQGGYFPLSFEGRWSRQGFVEYAQSPSVSFGGSDIRLVDLDGDGVIDALRTGAEFELFFNDRLKGWETVETRPRRPLESFPDLDFSDPHVKLGDMTGDNLQDFVLVQQGRIDYWPYLGHGNWGRRVTMKNSPVFRDVTPVPGGEGFDPERVLLGDLDGDGLDDIVYVEPQRLTFWINQSGEGWSEPTVVTATPPLTDVHAVRLADMLGAGTAGVLWTFDRIAGEGSNFQFLDLTGGLKPYVLTRMDNHMGAVTHVQYASSTKFYLADFAEPRTRWKTPLPFPVQVVERVEVIDALSGGKLTTDYRYHHGYWDGAEREFRGFGKVEQLDTETFEDFNGSGLGGETFEPVAARAFSPPKLTKTWFHLGPIGDEFAARSELDFRPEYFRDDPPVLVRPAETATLLQSLPASQRADAIRSLRGRVLWSEIYALDGDERQDRPFTVAECQYGIREESPPADGGGQRRRIFFAHTVAQRTTQWERGDEPMTRFTFTDDYDAFGQPRREVSLAVPRGRDYRRSAPPGEPYLGTMTETRFAQRVDAARHLVDRVAATTSFEILNDGSTSVFDLYARIQGGTAPRTLFGQTFNYYDGAAFVGLPPGVLGDFGALVRSESMVLAEEMLGNAYRDPADANAPRIPPYLRPAGGSDLPAEYPAAFAANTPALAGYVFADGSDHRARGYFAQVTRQAYDFHVTGLPRRGLPVTSRDPFGNDTTTTYDRPFHLCRVQLTDPAGLIARAEYDYRVLQPKVVTDVNANRRAVTFSPLGLVTATIAMGREGESIGDTLAAPGRRIQYDLLAFADRRQPISARSIVRRHHASDTDVPPAARNETIESVEYSDGFGRLLQTRTQADDVLFGDAQFGSGVLPLDQTGVTADVNGRRGGAGEARHVTVSGWQVYDNKGHVVEQFEPFFGVGFAYSKPAEAQFGQRTTMFYDARGQVVRTLSPDGSEQRIVHGIPDDLARPERFVPTPWEAFAYDPNDLAPLCEGPDGGSLADRAARTHHFTPTSTVIDALGRTVLTIARDRDAIGNPADPLPAIRELRTHSTYDIQGNPLSSTDALGRVAVRYIYDLANRPWRIEHLDAGVSRMVLNAAGQEIERRDSKGAVILQAHDRLQRPSRMWARDDTAGPVTLRQRLEYGDAGDPTQAPSERAAMRASNLLGELHRHYDEAGLTTATTIDFKGNALEKSRRVIADAPVLAVFEGSGNGGQITPFQVDWEPRSGQPLAERERELLEDTDYQTTSRFDALNRVTQVQCATDVEGRRREVRPDYNSAGQVERVRLDDTVFVERIAYDAKGQRTFIAYGNGVVTRYGYDPRTFRLTRLRSERFSRPNALTYRPRGEVLQDFAYEYDLVGNLLGILDRAPGSGILNNPEALTTRDPVLAQLLASGDALARRFDYDPLYRLIAATGRECDRPPEGPPFEDRPRPTDLTKTRPVSDSYLYDAAGNLLRLGHHSGDANFTREFVVETGSNRLREMKVGAAAFRYTFDQSGNLRSETASRHFEWNHSNQLKAFRIQNGGSEPSVHVHCLSDAKGERVKKLVRKQGGRVEVTHYVGGVFEHHREPGVEHNHVHVMDNAQRIAVVRVGPAHPDDRGPAVQFHLGDHLRSSSVVVGTDATLVNREEFTPYGETSFGSFAKKRYRFTGKERDEASGLTYHSARYYAPWLGRWVSCDPLGDIDGTNLYRYCRGTPLMLVDASGTTPDVPTTEAEIQQTEQTLQQQRVRLSQVQTDLAEATARHSHALRHLGSLEIAHKQAGGLRGEIRKQEAHIKKLGDAMSDLTRQRGVLENEVDGLQQRVERGRAYIRLGDPDADLNDRFAELERRGGGGGSGGGGGQSGPMYRSKPRGFGGSALLGGLGAVGDVPNIYGDFQEGKHLKGAAKTTTTLLSVFARTPFGIAVATAWSALEKADDPRVHAVSDVPADYVTRFTRNRVAGAYVKAQAHTYASVAAAVVDTAQSCFPHKCGALYMGYSMISSLWD